VPATSSATRTTGARRSQSGSMKTVARPWSNRNSGSEHYARMSRGAWWPRVEETAYVQPWRESVRVTRILAQRLKAVFNDIEPVRASQPCRRSPWRLEPSFLDAVERSLGRTTKVEIARNDGQLYVAIDENVIEGTLERVDWSTPMRSC
jgi:hypothetical protein